MLSPDASARCARPHCRIPVDWVSIAGVLLAALSRAVSRRNRAILCGDPEDLRGGRARGSGPNADLQPPTSRLHTPELTRPGDFSQMLRRLSQDRPFGPLNRARDRQPAARIRGRGSRLRPSFERQLPMRAAFSAGGEEGAATAATPPPPEMPPLFRSAGVRAPFPDFAGRIVAASAIDRCSGISCQPVTQLVERARPIRSVRGFKEPVRWAALAVALV